MNPLIKQNHLMYKLKSHGVEGFRRWLKKVFKANELRRCRVYFFIDFFIVF